MKLTKEFLEAVRALDRAFANLEEAWDDNHENSEWCKADYPFELSFDQMAIAVGNWRDAVELEAKDLAATNN